MNKNILLRVTGGGLFVVFAGLVLALVLGAFGRSAETAVVGALAPNDAAIEGIQVHGSWTIEIREPDGALVSRNSFENALTPIGATALARILGRERSVGAWLFTVEGGSGNNHPCFVNTGPAVCFLFEPPGVDMQHSFYNLTVEVPSSGTNLNKLVLSGHVTAGRDGIIGRVSTGVTTCSPTVAPSDCPTSVGTGSTITGTVITPVPVQNGQQILVTVVISFS